MDSKPSRIIIRNKQIENISKVSTPLKLPPSPLLKSLGFGTGVNVFRLDRSPLAGRMRSPWAIKRISRTTRGSNRQILFETRLKSEADILRKLSHPNIVGFRAYKKTTDGYDSLAIECCHTSLGTILEDRLESDTGSLPANLILKVCLDITKALDYLHNAAKLLHGDIKSFNILIKDNFNICKLCDFGVSIPLNVAGEINFNENPQFKYIGTELWSAPEIIDEENIISDKADIFSFGLVIYETIALIPPHTWNIMNESETENENITDDENKYENNGETEILYGTRPPLPEAFILTDEYNKIVEIFFACTNELPENRPSAKYLVTLLSAN